MSTKRSRGIKSQPAIARHIQSDAVSLAYGVYLSLGTPVSQDCFRLLHQGRYLDLVKKEISPSEYDSSSAFRDDLLSVSLLQKFPFGIEGLDRRQVALDAFLESERECAKTNLRLRQGYVHSLLSKCTPEAIFYMARGKIARLLGPLNWDRVEPLFGFGPGATVGLKAKHGDRYYKFRSKPDVTRSCAILAYTAIRRIPAWYSHVVSLSGESSDAIEDMPIDLRVEKLFKIVSGNRITTVAKNAKTDRCIAMEPLLNGFIQHGLGRFIRRRLKRVGVDLDDQQPNQLAARLASLGWRLSTLDLKAASDTISLELCRELLPSDWFSAVSLCRSPVGVMPDGTKVSYQKVSSMGNGCTFELESLIFWALCSSVLDSFSSPLRHCFVYGDDLVVPRDLAHSICWILDFAGFTVNKEKSHVDGVYHESCGKHYFRGDDVTPLYLREEVRTSHRMIWFCNQIRRWSRLFWGLDARFRWLYEYGVSKLPHALRVPSTPDGLGDGALFGDFDECRPRRAPFGLSGWMASSYVRIARTREFSDVPYLLRALSVMGEPRDDHPWSRDKRILVGSGVPINHPDAWRRVVHSKPVLTWPSYGPWDSDIP